MNAKEMFEKLGYEKQETERYIKYVQSFEEGNGSIEFSKIDRTICSYLNYGEALPIDTKDVKALIQQVKELGWIDG